MRKAIDGWKSKLTKEAIGGWKSKLMREAIGGFESKKSRGHTKDRDPDTPIVEKDLLMP